MTKKFMTDLQHFEAMSRLKEHLHHVEGGFAYDAGWNDKRIADESGATITNIYGLRLRVYGPLASVPAPAARDARLEDLIAKHNELVRRFSVLNPGDIWETLIVEQPI